MCTFILQKIGFSDMQTYWDIEIINLACTLFRVDTISLN